MKITIPNPVRIRVNEEKIGKGTGGDNIRKNQFDGQAGVMTVNAINKSHGHTGGLNGFFRDATEPGYSDAQDRRYIVSTNKLGINTYKQLDVGSAYAVAITPKLRKNLAEGVDFITDVVFPDARDFKKTDVTKKQINYETALTLAYIDLFKRAVEKGVTRIQMPLGGAGIFNNDADNSGKKAVFTHDVMAKMQANALTRAIEKVPDFKGEISITTDRAYGNGLLKDKLDTALRAKNSRATINDGISKTAQEGTAKSPSSNDLATLSHIRELSLKQQKKQHPDTIYLSENQVENPEAAFGEAPELETLAKNATPKAVKGHPGIYALSVAKVTNETPTQRGNRTRNLQELAIYQIAKDADPALAIAYKAFTNARDSLIVEEKLRKNIPIDTNESLKTNQGLRTDPKEQKAVIDRITHEVSARLALALDRDSIIRNALEENMVLMPDLEADMLMVSPKPKGLVASIAQALKPALTLSKDKPHVSVDIKTAQRNVSQAIGEWQPQVEEPVLNFKTSHKQPEGSPDSEAFTPEMMSSRSGAEEDEQKPLQLVIGNADWMLSDDIDRLVLDAAASNPNVRVFDAIDGKEIPGVAKNTDAKEVAFIRSTPLIGVFEGTGGLKGAVAATIAQNPGKDFECIVHVGGNHFIAVYGEKAQGKDTYNLVIVDTLAPKPENGKLSDYAQQINNELHAIKGLTVEKTLDLSGVAAALNSNNPEDLSSTQQAHDQTDEGGNTAFSCAYHDIAILRLFMETPQGKVSKLTGLSPSNAAGFDDTTATYALGPNPIVTKDGTFKKQELIDYYDGILEVIKRKELEGVGSKEAGPTFEEVFRELTGELDRADKQATDITQKRYIQARGRYNAFKTKNLLQKDEVDAIEKIIDNEKNQTNAANAITNILDVAEGRYRYTLGRNELEVYRTGNALEEQEIKKAGRINYLVEKNIISRAQGAKHLWELLDNVHNRIAGHQAYIKASDRMGGYLKVKVEDNRLNETEYESVRAIVGQAESFEITKAVAARQLTEIMDGVDQREQRVKDAFNQVANRLRDYSAANRLNQEEKQSALENNSKLRNKEITTEAWTKRAIALLDNVDQRENAIQRDFDTAKKAYHAANATLLSLGNQIAETPKLAEAAFINGKVSQGQYNAFNQKGEVLKSRFKDVLKSINDAPNDRQMLQEMPAATEAFESLRKAIEGLQGAHADLVKKIQETRLPTTTGDLLVSTLQRDPYMQERCLREIKTKAGLDHKALMQGRLAEVKERIIKRTEIIFGHEQEIANLQIIKNQAANQDNTALVNAYHASLNVQAEKAKLTSKNEVDELAQLQLQVDLTPFTKDGSLPDIQALKGKVNDKIRHLENNISLDARSVRRETDLTKRGPLVEEIRRKTILLEGYQDLKKHIKTLGKGDLNAGVSDAVVRQYPIVDGKGNPLPHVVSAITKAYHDDPIPYTNKAYTTEENANNNKRIAELSKQLDKTWADLVKEAKRNGSPSGSPYFVKKMEQVHEAAGLMKGERPSPSDPIYNQLHYGPDSLLAWRINGNSTNCNPRLENLATQYAYTYYQYNQALEGTKAKDEKPKPFSVKHNINERIQKLEQGKRIPKATIEDLYYELHKTNPELYSLAPEAKEKFAKLVSKHLLHDIKTRKDQLDAGDSLKTALKRTTSHKLDLPRNVLGLDIYINYEGSSIAMTDMEGNRVVNPITMEAITDAAMKMNPQIENYAFGRTGYVNAAHVSLQEVRSKRPLQKAAQSVVKPLNNVLTALGLPTSSLGKSSITQMAEKYERTPDDMRRFDSGLLQVIEAEMQEMEKSIAAHIHQGQDTKHNQTQYSMNRKRNAAEGEAQFGSRLNEPLYGTSTRTDTKLITSKGEANVFQKWLGISRSNKEISDTVRGVNKVAASDWYTTYPVSAETTEEKKAKKPSTKLRPSTRFWDKMDEVSDSTSEPLEITPQEKAMLAKQTVIRKLYCGVLLDTQRARAFDALHVTPEQVKAIYDNGDAQHYEKLKKWFVTYDQVNRTSSSPTKDKNFIKQFIDTLEPTQQSILYKKLFGSAVNPEDIGETHKDEMRKKLFGKVSLNKPRDEEIKALIEYGNKLYAFEKTQEIFTKAIGDTVEKAAVALRDSKVGKEQPKPSIKPTILKDSPKPRIRPREDELPTLGEVIAQLTPDLPIALFAETVQKGILKQINVIKKTGLEGKELYNLTALSVGNYPDQISAADIVEAVVNAYGKELRKGYWLEDSDTEQDLKDTCLLDVQTAINTVQNMLNEQIEKQTADVTPLQTSKEAVKSTNFAQDTNFVAGKKLKQDSSKKTGQPKPQTPDTKIEGTFASKVPSKGKNPIEPIIYRDARANPFELTQEQQALLDKQKHLTQQLNRVTGVKWELSVKNDMHDPNKPDAAVRIDGSNVFNTLEKAQYAANALPKALNAVAMEIPQIQVAPELAMENIQRFRVTIANPAADIELVQSKKILNAFKRAEYNLDDFGKNKTSQQR